MEIVLAIPLSLTTLMGFMALPFVYYGAHLRLWYRPDVLRRTDFILSAVALVLAAIVLLKMLKASHLGIRGNPELYQLAILHLAPLILLLMSVRHNRAPAAPRSGGKSEARESDGSEFRPIPLNSQVESLSWDDLVVDQELKQEIWTVIELLRDPKTAKQYGIEAPKGILLNGPPGTGKTTIAKVIANTAGLAFFAVKLDEVVSKWVGESEKNLSRLFNAAKKYSPAVIFIDEVDSIGQQRSGEFKWADNLVNHLLQLIDGVIKTEGLYIVAATNRQDLVDPALKRAGRLNKVIEIPLPDLDARVKLFALYLSRLKVAANIDVMTLAEVTEGASGADIREICNQAGLNAFRRESGARKRDYLVQAHDLSAALNAYLSAPKAGVAA